MYAIVDCNNFYVSCERVFNPALWEKPVIVLSNNDGCVIARSNEAKLLGIQMGQPFFQIKALCQSAGIQIYSSNYALYGDMSNRVMRILEEQWPEIEAYSIDEAFLDLKGLSPQTAYHFCSKLHRLILQYTGIPVSIGIGGTKTLAKLANGIAKKNLKSPCFNITGFETLLEDKPVSDVWGIGHRWAKRLNALGIISAGDLKKACPHRMRRQFNVVLEQVIFELNGLSCLSLQEIEPKKSIVSSRSFAKLQVSEECLMEALASFCDIAATKLRHQKSVCNRIGIFLRTNPFRSDLKQYSAAHSLRLAYPSQDTRVLIKAARLLLAQLFKAGYAYKKIGVYFEEITPKQHQQLGLIDLESQHDDRFDLPQSEALMAVYDGINRKFGPSSIRTASSHFQRSEATKRSHCSPKYTTSWSELKTVYL